MKNYTFAKWCLEAVSQIKYTADRDEVYEELRAHLEDHRDALMEQGIPREEAEKRALEGMGSAKEIAPQLAAVHKPFWGYVYSIMVRVTKVLVAFTCWMLLVMLIGQIDRAQTADAYQSPTPDYFADTSFDTEYRSGQRIARYDLNHSVKCDNYTICLEEAALWEMTTNHTSHSELYIKMIIHNPWANGYAPDFQEWFWVEDSLGNVSNPAKFDMNFTYFHIDDSRSNYSTYGFVIRQFDPTAEWVDLKYDRGGRTMRFRVTLTGGDES